MEITQRLAWRLAQLSTASGLSVPFLRKEAKLGNLKTQKRGGAVIVLDEDARAYLAGEKAAQSQGSQLSKAA